MGLFERNKLYLDEKYDYIKLEENEIDNEIEDYFLLH